MPVYVYGVGWRKKEKKNGGGDEKKSECKRRGVIRTMNNGIGLYAVRRD